MPEPTPGNFLDDIHTPDHRRRYESDPLPSGRSSLLDASTLLDLGTRATTSLDGPWHFAVDAYDTCLRARWYAERVRDEQGRPLPVDYSFDEWETIPVPSCWNTEREAWRLYEGPAVYVRTFDAPPAAGRTFLHFEGAASAAYVFLNGTYLGWHRGGSTPFSVEVTAALRPVNRLLVVVDSTRRPRDVPSDNVDWFTYGGLHRSVRLVTVPETFIRTATVALRPDGRFNTVDVAVEIDGPDADGAATVEIPALGLRAGIDVVGGRGRASLPCAPELWHPTNPRLYDVVVRYGADTWSERVGFREVRVDGTEILLNGEPVFLAGVCQHEESLEHGRSLTEAEIRQNFALAKELGCNFVRLAHYPHSGLTARVADEVGMLLWEEVPVYWALAFDDPGTADDAANQIAELVVRDRNRASVVVWSVGNENPDTDARLAFMTRLATTARGLDPTRLVSAACLVDPAGPVIADRLTEVVDVVGVNEYYGWYDPDLGKLPRLFAASHVTKPVVVTEFGADGVAGLRGPETEMFTEDFQLAVYRGQLEALGGIPAVKGTCPWVLYDFRSPRRLHARQRGYNRKGLLDETRTHRKLAFEAVREFYAARAAAASGDGAERSV